MPGMRGSIGRVRVIVGVGFRLQIGADEGLVIARRDPLRDVEMAVAIRLEPGGIGRCPQGEILAAEMGCGAPGRLLLQGDRQSTRAMT